MPRRASSCCLLRDRRRREKHRHGGIHATAVRVFKRRVSPEQQPSPGSSVGLLGGGVEGGNGVCGGSGADEKRCGQRRWWR